MNTPWGTVQASGSHDPRALVVILHGFRMKPSKMKSVVDIIKGAHPDSDVWVPEMPHSFGLSCHGLERTKDDLAEMLDAIWSSEYTSLILVGHSTGGPLTRALYLRGREKNSDWAEVMRINPDSRIIMLAGMNNGWRIDHHLSRMTALLWSAMEMVGQIMQAFKKRPTILDLKRSSMFLTKLRFAWSELKPEDLPNLTIQLLGTIDDLVGPDDVIDLVTGTSFRYLDVPHSGHTSVLKMGQDDKFGKERAEVLRIALSDEEKIKANEVRPWGIDDESSVRAEEVEKVIFVIHGIRDEGYWTDKIARHVWKRSPAELRPRIRRVSASYGYFGMGPFLFPGVRRQKVEWLVEEVLIAHARYPNARFSYIGHSNGTYLLAKALEDYREVEQFQFDKVVFAGSVVKSNYQWSDKRVGGVLNMVANRDWVVAFFPQLFELIKVQDLGSAGHNGFSRLERSVTNGSYADGGHGAAIQD